MLLDLGMGMTNGKRLPPGYIEKWLAPDMVGTIGLSTANYLSIGSAFQATFFVDVNTPIEHTLTDWSAILSTHENINLLNVIGTPEKGWVTYSDDTNREILNKALRWFGLPEVVPELSSFNELTAEQFDALTIERFDALNI